MIVRCSRFRNQRGLPFTGKGYGLFSVTGSPDGITSEARAGVSRCLGDIGYKFLQALCVNSLLVKRRTTASGDG